MPPGPHRTTMCNYQAFFSRDWPRESKDLKKVLFGVRSATAADRQSLAGGPREREPGMKVPAASAGPSGRLQFVMCAVTSALLNILFKASVMSAGVLAVKKKFGDAQA
jgi:hypothetical protein